MRHGNLPDGNSDKVTWKYSKDLLPQQHCGNIILRHSGDVPQQYYWVFHLGVTGNIVEMCKREIVDMRHWGVLVIYHWDVIGCFIWDLFEMLCRCTDGTLLIHPPKTPSWHSNKMLWRHTSEMLWQCSTKMSMGIWFVTYLQHHWDVQRDLVTKAPQHLVADWVLLIELLLNMYKTS